MAITGSKNSDLSPGERAMLDRMKSNGGATSGGGKVYMGSRSVITAADEKAGRAPRASQDAWLSEDDAYQDFFSWGKKKQNDFLAQGIVGGMLKLGDGPMEASKLWKKLVKESAAYGKSGKKVSPIDIMAAYVGSSGGAGRTWVRQGDFEVNVVTGERRYVGPQFKTQTDTRTDLTDPDTARAIATKLFQDLMGRDPGAGELGAFATALHSAEEQSPVVSTSTTEFDMTTGEPIGTTTKSSGGLDSAGKAYIGEQQIKKKKEYGAFQAATTYQNALDALVFGGPE